ncbi:MAG: GNAT family N-acetyltransferase [Pseudomonadota bacterium]
MSATTVFRRAALQDLPAIVALLADDPLGAGRERPGDPAYDRAFSAIAADPNQLLAVLEEDGRVVGCLQISFIPGLGRGGIWRGQIEAVRIARHARGRGLGRALMTWAIEQCRARGCALVQLTSDRQRPQAHRLYASLGFVASHEGFKLALL